MPRSSFLFSLFAIGACLLSGCYPYDTTPKLCEAAVPEGACPTGRGGTCDDPSCNALYDCIESEWQLITTCPAHTGGGGSGAGGGAGGQTTSTGGTGGMAGGGTGAGGGGGQCTPVGFDHTGESTGCVPDLQVPDCPASAADPCEETACLTDCLDFYLCREDASGKGWVPVGYCDDAGKLVITPP